MNITTINKVLKNNNETKNSIAIKAGGKGKYYIKDKGTIAFFTIENNSITHLKFTTERMNNEIFSCLYSFNLISFDAKIIIDNKEYNLFECEKLFGFLNYLEEDKEELLKEIKRANSIIESSKKDIEINNIKLKELINNGYTEKEFSPVKKEIEYYKKRLNKNEQLLKVLNEMIEETEKEKTIDKNNNTYKGLIALGFEVNEEVKEVKETMFTKARLYSIELDGKEIGIYTEQVNQYGGCPVEYMYFVDYYEDEDVRLYIMNHKINNEVAQEEEISKTHAPILVEEKETNEEIDNKKETKENYEVIDRIIVNNEVESLTIHYLDTKYFLLVNDSITAITNFKDEAPANWHWGTSYSIKNIEEAIKTLVTYFNMTEEEAIQLLTVEEEDKTTIKIMQGVNVSPLNKEYKDNTKLDEENFYSHEIITRYNSKKEEEEQEEVKTMNKYNKEERAKKVVEKMGVEYKEGMTLDDLLNDKIELVKEEDQEAFENNTIIKTMNKYNKEERAQQVVEKMGVEYKEGMTLDDLLNDKIELVKEEEQEAIELVNQVAILPSTQEKIDKGLDLLWNIEDLINKVDKELEEEKEKMFNIVDELKDINYFKTDTEETK